MKRADDTLRGQGKQCINYSESYAGGTKLNVYLEADEMRGDSIGI